MCDWGKHYQCEVLSRCRSTMLSGKLLFALPFLILIHHTCHAFRLDKNQDCTPCGIHNIRYPFRLKTDPSNCGNKECELFCENNRTMLYWKSQKHYVQAINYNNYTIRLVHAEFLKDNNNCSSFSYPPYMLNYDWLSPYENIYDSVVVINCENPENFQSFLHTSPCNNSTFYNSSFSHSKRYLYVIPGYYSVVDLADRCRIEQMLITSLLSTDYYFDDVSYLNYLENVSYLNYLDNVSYINLRDIMTYGFELDWYSSKACCKSKQNRCNMTEEVLCFFNTGDPILYDATVFLSRLVNAFRDLIIYHHSHYNDYKRAISDLHYNWPAPLGKRILNLVIVFLVILPFVIVLYHVALFFCGLPCVITFLIYKWRRRHLSMFDTIEEFLRSQGDLMPVRYSYSDIKKITKGFRDKLGEGGYGSVYKGKLRSGRLVAVKVLGKSKTNGQEFINEVATIGRIHHVNVVQLIGFCAEGSKRALIYEFMPNGSLDKNIFSREGSITISNEQMYEISLGVARGIEYLHQGCDKQILHFDIKPHNILLDEKFIPKVSDFGLAKLYPTDTSIVSLTAARGTMGYMAPELFYKNVGSISYKADVYSFGMLLMEMVGRRKNLHVLTEHLSQIYFPSWVYDQFSKGKDVELCDSTEEEKKITKKMIMVASWCIQLKPSDRPSMHKVVEMLERDVENLPMPPKPLVTPQEMPKEDARIDKNPIELTNLANTDSMSLVVDAN